MNIVITLYPFKNIICFKLNVLEIKACIPYESSKSIDIDPILNAETIFLFLFICNQNAIEAF